jgi:hypothetical protein
MRIEFQEMSLRSAVRHEGTIIGWVSITVYDGDAPRCAPYDSIRIHACRYLPGLIGYATVNGPHESMEEAGYAIVREHERAMAEAERERMLQAETLPPQPPDGTRVQWELGGGE